MTATKECTHCHDSKPLDAYPPQTRMRDGRSSWCRSCAAGANRRWRAANPDYIDSANAARRVDHPERACTACGMSFAARRVDSRTCCRVCGHQLRVYGRPYSPEGAVNHQRTYHPSTEEPT